MNLKKENFWLFLMALSVLLFVWGCADSSTTGTSKDIDTNVSFHISNVTGDVNINPGTDLTGSVGDTDQETKNSASVDPKTTANLGLNGGAATGQIDAAAAIAKPVGEFFKDLSTKDSNNPQDNKIDNSAAAPVVADPAVTTSTETAEEVAVDGLTYRVSLRQTEMVNNKRFIWLARAGKEYTAPLVVSFPECVSDTRTLTEATMVIDDPSKAFGVDGNTDNHSQMFYFSGDPAQQDDTNNGLASIFGPEGCSAATYALMNQPNK